jgi:uncharacterized membrane protein SirB2
LPDYLTVKAIHQVMVALSIIGFSLRGVLMMRGSALLMRRWMRSWPHLIDTLLLASGIGLAVQLHLDPLAHPWLATKLVLLLLYIALGFIALRLGRTRQIRILAFAAALTCFAYMTAVALSKSPLPGSVLADVIQTDRDLRDLRLHQAIAIDTEIAAAVEHARDVG